MVMHRSKSTGASAPRAAQHISKIDVDKYILHMDGMRSMPSLGDIPAADIDTFRNLRDKQIDELAGHNLTGLKMQANL